MPAAGMDTRSPAGGRRPGARLALLGDVHGNLAALEAVLAAVSAAGITRGVLTGDLAARGGQPEECVALLRDLGWPCAQGNTDREAARSARLSPTARAYLRALPPTVTLTLGGRYRVLVCHDPDAVACRAARAGAYCVVTGHTHRPRVGRGATRLAIDPGSVGEGLPGDPRPSWAWVEIGPSRLEAHLERVEAPLASIRTPRGLGAARAAGP